MPHGAQGSDLLRPCVEHDCSKLVFAVNRVGTHGTPPLDQLRRVREPVSRSKAGVQGKVADVVFGRSRHAASQNELKAFQIVMAAARADSWQEQPFTLEYRHAGAKHRYTPDALLIWEKIKRSSRSRKIRRPNQQRPRQRSAQSRIGSPSMAITSAYGKVPRFERSRVLRTQIWFFDIAALGFPQGSGKACAARLFQRPRSNFARFARSPKCQSKVCCAW
jgi:hypothetical protein